MKKTIKNEIISWIQTCFVALIIYLIFNLFILVAKVEGTSMEPNLHQSDTVIVNKMAYNNNQLSYEDIIVFDCEIKKSLLIKRIIGLPGDNIQIKDGIVYRNGTELKETYIIPNTIGNIDEIVQENHVFVLGDNRPDSADSRYPQIGQIKYKDIKGKVFFRLFPNPKKY